ncbi:MAG: hypothetical protein ACPL1D_02865, partial [Microgenomates group bacterium]
FTGRFIAVVLAKVLGIYRQRTRKTKKFKDKVCLNLFFDERALQVPKFKQTEYVAHEVLQMKPVVNKDNLYERFLKANKWVKKFFPNVGILNSKLKIKNPKLQLKIQNFKFLIFILRFPFFILDFFGKKNEELLKKTQMFLINKHKTTEIITDSQLWFHPDDSEKKFKLP